MSYRIGVDIGGTFTDLVLVDDAGTVFEVAKVLTSSTDPARAVGEGIEALLSATAVPVDEISHVVHGTTLFANALIERKGARTALITTAGFRDALEIAREHRYDMYDLRLERAAPLVPRHLRFEVDERVLEDGSVHRPLDLDGAGRVVEQLRAQSVEAVAVCLLHGYANPDHERAIGQLLRERAPEMACSLSCDVSPEIREYERTSTTVANVFIQGLADSYLTRLAERLRELGIAGTLFVMQSNGGICTVDLACKLPIHLVESGPAAGSVQRRCWHADGWCCFVADARHHRATARHRQRGGRKRPGAVVDEVGGKAARPRSDRRQGERSGRAGTKWTAATGSPRNHTGCTGVYGDRGAP